MCFKNRDRGIHSMLSMMPLALWKKHMFSTKTGGRKFHRTKTRKKRVFEALKISPNNKRKIFYIKININIY